MAAATLFGCGERERHAAASHTLPLARGISAEIGTRLGVAVIARCRGILGMPVACDLELPDHGALGVHVYYAAGTWDWSLDGLVITTDAIVEYIGAELAELAVAPRPISCAPRIRRVLPADRIECTVGDGGKAFVTLDGDGGIAGLEVVLDPSAATARSEEVSTERAARLDKMSRDLATEGEPDDDDDDDGGPPSDAPGHDGVE
ncbi:MAG: hypothetical protein H0T79_18240 [Deltaproteobacteria bacterium]|nr:hypothetical protein [Deltaproteobacteria bacterium]